MTALSLLGPNARPMVAIGHGPGVWKSRHIKGILCSFQWLDLRQHGEPDTDDNACVPCMCLMRPSSEEKGVYVIPQANAFLMATTKGGYTAQLATSSFAAAERLQMDMHSRSSVHTIMQIIVEAISDLVEMPSEPPNSLDALVKKHTHGIEATAKINGVTIHTEVL